MNKITAVAPANFALIKYWGKRDEANILPFSNSISVTVDKLLTKTTIEVLKDDYQKNLLFLNGKEMRAGEKEKVESFLRLKEWEKILKGRKLKIVSETTFPVKAGLASSASGFAALSFALAKVLQNEFNSQEISRLARKGSGSASRSIYGGFVEWNRGSDKNSFSVPLHSRGFWPDFRVIIIIVSKNRKKISSRQGMNIAKKTSPNFPQWIEQTDLMIPKMKKAIQKRSLKEVGYWAEKSCLLMHATTFTSDPAFYYFTPDTFRILDIINKERENELPGFFTIDAGPNVKLLTLAKWEKKWVDIFEKYPFVSNLIVCKPGRGAFLTDKHLF